MKWYTEPFLFNYNSEFCQENIYIDRDWEFHNELWLEMINLIDKIFKYVKGKLEG